MAHMFYNDLLFVTDNRVSKNMGALRCVKIIYGKQFQRSHKVHQPMCYV